jgi:hypothetical protein
MFSGVMKDSLKKPGKSTERNRSTISDKSSTEGMGEPKDGW